MKKSIFFTVVVLFSTTMFAAQEQADFQRALTVYQQNRHEVEKWAGFVGSVGGWGFFAARGKPWGRYFLAGFLCASTVINAGRFTKEQQQPNNTQF